MQERAVDLVSSGGSDDFLSNAIYDEIREYALSLGFETVIDYSIGGTSAGDGWALNVRTDSSGRCRSISFGIYSGYSFWSYDAYFYDESFPVDHGLVYNLDEMKAVIAEYANYQ